MQARLCEGVQNWLQVMLHETSEPYPFVPETDEMLVTQMRCLGLSQFIDLPNVKIPGSEARPTRKRGHLVDIGGSESSKEGGLPQSGVGGDTIEGECLKNLLSIGLMTHSRISHVHSGPTLHVC